MRNLFYLTLIVTSLLITSCGSKREGKPKVLVFSKTMGFKHASIPKGMAAIQELGVANGFVVDTTKNAELINEENLQQYAAVIFLSTTGNVLDHVQEAAFERYIQAGGGYVGIHAATDTEYDWGWYNKLVGAYFLSHPNGTPEANFVITDKNFAATNFFTDTIWRRKDELYNYKKINSDINVVMTLDESSYEGGENGDFHPIAWYHEFDGGRAFYTGAGHTDESYVEENFLQHLLGGIQYAMGENEQLDYAKATSQLPPDADRFAKKTLAFGEFFEPTEMTILPNGDVLVAERRGAIKLYSNETKEITEVANFNVYHKTLNTPGVNAEEGVMGLKKDPDYANNHWVYVFYSPSGDTWVNRLSRFKFKDGIFDKASEQVILDVASQREICCHTGGSIAFDANGLLYLSTGDNSTPFDEEGATYVNNGFAPLNNLAGKEQYDARRSSGNTNDLRGKIIRIQVQEDGSYNIPEGNLFPKGTAKTRPEIYTMGHRNPYRISVDQKNGYVYWGDIGPDSRADNIAARGPRGYDEMNQAKEAGNFGWPLFIGDNKPYVAYDYANGKSGVAFDPNAPINDSKNNTGLRELPKAMPAYAFYPYVDTQDFPQLNAGGRNAMAGPVIYTDLYPNSEAVPSYYDGKIIIYDWMRGWMKAVTLFPNGDVNKMEPFAPDVVVNSLIDMELGPDGRIYLLEYGSGWFSKNDNAALSYIEYNGGNRAPLIDNLIVDKTSGKLPLSITASVEARDREGDAISYLWDLGNGETKETQEPQVSYTYEDAGEYKVSVTVKDNADAAVSSKTIPVVAGNSRPEIAIDLSGGNSSFFIGGVPVQYTVSVTDPDGNADIDESNIYVSVDYMEGMDEVNMSLGHQQVSAAVTGKAITQGMDCKACHKENATSVGPSYLQIAQKYDWNSDMLSYLQDKIINGGSGVWGEVVMPSHPNVTADESRQIALYIQSLVSSGSQKESLPITGSVIPKPSISDNVFVLTASYTDNGVGNAKPLTGIKTIRLRGSTVSFSPTTKVEGFQAVSFNGQDLLVVPLESGWFALEDIDLTGVKSAYITAGWPAPPKGGLQFEMRLDAPDGTLLGTGNMPTPVPGQQGGLIPINLETPMNGIVKTLYFVHKPIVGEDRGASPLVVVNVQFNGK